jgi:TATA-box binding protein (TBP) (component of TFIID and TFIIIB)
MDLDKAIDTITNNFENLLSKTPTITTMTLFFTTTLDQLDLDFVRDTIFSIDPKSISFDILSPSKDKKSFKHCFMFKIRPHELGGTCSIKLFSNGTIHFTGAKSIASATNYCTSLLHKIANAAEVIEDSLRIEDVRIQMLNCGFSFRNDTRGGYALKELAGSFLSQQSLQGSIKSITYDPNHHHAVNMKLAIEEERVSTFLFYRSGSSLVTGVKSVADLFKTFDIIKNAVLPFVQHYQSQPVVKEKAPPVKRGRKRKNALDGASVDPFYDKIDL